MYHLATILLAVLVAGIPCNGQLVGDLAQALQDELLAIITNTLVLTGQCDPVNVDSVSFLLFTRDNTDTPTLLTENNLDELTREKTIVITHGWMSGPDQSYFPNLKDSYLDLYDANVIMVNWTEVAAELYTSSYCELPAVAEIVGEFLCNLSSVTGIPLNSVHLIGHSLGAHISGIAGQNTQTICSQIVGRISGLDPAGPLFQGAPLNKRLDPSDASFVDIIHSNAGEFGYVGQIGTIDFNPNGGSLQPGCLSIDITNLFSSTLLDVGCSHSRSIDLMAASTLKTATSTNALVGRAQSCIFCPLLCFLCPPEFSMMGEFCRQDTDAESFALTTTSSWPYGKGCVPFGNNAQCIDVVNDIPS